MGAIIFFGAGAFLGLVLGFLTGRYAKTKQIESWPQKFILLAVVMLYTLSILTGITNPSYETPWFLHAIAGLIFGHYFEFNFERIIPGLRK